MKHIIISGSIGILLAAQAGCGGDDGPPWPQEDAEQATRSIVIMAFASTTAAGEQSPGADGTLNAEVPCATGGTAIVSGDLSVAIDGNELMGTADIDMTMAACGFDGSSMEGPLTYVETIHIDSSGENIEVNGSIRGRIRFSGALEGTCAIALGWEVDFDASPFGTVVIEGRACGQDVSLNFDNLYIPSGNDEVWDVDEAETVARGIFDVGDSGKRAIDDEYDNTGEPMLDVVDLTSECHSGGSQTITGTRTETTDGSITTIEYALSLVLDACDVPLPKVSGTLESLQVERFDGNTGEVTFTADISGEVTVSDPWLPSSTCALDLHRAHNIPNGGLSITGMACGQSISLDF